MRTRVTTSGKADSVTMNSLPLFEIKNTTHDDEPLELCLDSREPDETVTENTVPSKPAKKRRKKANDSVRSPISTKPPSTLLTPLQTKMRTFLDVRPTVLDDMVTLDGPGNNRLDLCSSCGSVDATPLYRCLECSYSLLCCRECILKSHTMLPLHRLEVSPISRPSSRRSLLPVLEGRLFRQDLPSFTWARLLPRTRR